MHLNKNKKLRSGAYDYIFLSFLIDVKKAIFSVDFFSIIPCGGFGLSGRFGGSGLGGLGGG
ncbi:hypothetical protein [Chryseobacterium sp.]|uniref:hypothetical protein n=1 Tax=Chryseobacterium sp. TaxID=1871047 RepID=UPI002897BA28|nr:hypothetical protein [Chryseobacterium sp.]